MTRPLAERDPLEVVIGTGAIGAACTGLAAVARCEPNPSAMAALALIA